MANILLITVNFRTPGSIVEFCSAARSRASVHQLAIAVADNSSCFSKPGNAASAAELAKLGVAICDPGENLGYFGGARFAYDALSQKPAHPDWVIVANSDIAFLTEDFFSRLQALQIDHDVLGVGPDIVRLPPGTRPERARFRENPPRKSRPSARVLRLHAYALRSRLLTAVMYLRAGLRRKYGPSQGDRPAPRERVYMIHGSFMILHRDYFARTAGLDFPSFLFGEELFVAEEVRRVGGALILEPGLRLAHVGGNSTSILPSDHRRRLEQASLQILSSRYFQRKSDT